MQTETFCRWKKFLYEKANKELHNFFINVTIHTKAMFCKLNKPYLINMILKIKEMNAQIEKFPDSIFGSRYKK